MSPRNTDHSRKGPSRLMWVGIFLLVCVIFADVVLFVTANNQSHSQPISTQEETADKEGQGTEQEQVQVSEQESEQETTQEKTEQAEAQEKPESKPEAEVENPSQDEPAAQNEALAAQLNATVADVASSSGMNCAISVIDLRSGTTASHNGSGSMVAASMIKLIVAEAFLEQVQAGAFSLDAVYTLQPQDIVGGTGSLQGRGAGAEVTYRELVELMISASDNVAANVLIDAVGMDTVNAAAQRLGLGATQLNRRMMDTDAQAAGLENYVSADDIAKLLQMVYNSSFVDADSSSLVLGALERQEDTAGILTGLPAGTAFAHKTGSLDTARNDGGIVEGDKPYVLVVLCSGDGYTLGGAEYTMSQAAERTYNDIQSVA